MRYVLLCAFFLLVSVAIACVLARKTRRVPFLALTVAVLALFLLTAVFDTLMIASGLFTYAEGSHLGWRVGLAPLEDFAYPLAAVILLPALWVRLTRGRRAPAEPAVRHPARGEASPLGDPDVP